MLTGWKTFLLWQKDMIDSSDGLLNGQITRDEMKSCEENENRDSIEEASNVHALLSE